MIIQKSHFSQEKRQIVFPSGKVTPNHFNHDSATKPYFIEVSEESQKKMALQRIDNLRNSLFL